MRFAFDIRCRESPSLDADGDHPSGVRSVVRLRTQKLFVHQRVKYQLAHRPLNAAQTLHLVGFQPQSGHFQILGTEMAEDIFNRSHDGSLFETKEICLRSNSSTANPGHDDIPASVSTEVANRCMVEDRAGFKS